MLVGGNGFIAIYERVEDKKDRYVETKRLALGALRIQYAAVFPSEVMCAGVDGWLGGWVHLFVCVWMRGWEWVLLWVDGHVMADNYLCMRVVCADVHVRFGG
jgi:hypothetical protein